MMSLREYSDPNEPCLADYIPWACLVGPGIVEHKDGALQKTFLFRGHDLDSSTARELMTTSALFNNAMRRLGDGWTLFLEAQRNATSDYPACLWPNKAARLIDEERSKNFKCEDRFFKNDYYLTFVFKRHDNISRRGGSWFLTKAAQEEKINTFDDILENFSASIKEITSLLSSLFPLFRELNDDETLTYLHSTISSKRHPVNTPDTPMYLDHILSDESVEHGLELKLGDNYVRVLSIKAFPSESFPGILDALNDMDFPFRWSTRFIFMGHEAGKSHIEKIRRIWYAGRKRVSTIIKEVATQSESALGESSSLRRSEDADEAMQLLDEGHVSFGFFTATVSVWNPASKIADERILK